jgi:hypothetical protein
MATIDKKEILGTSGPDLRKWYTTASTTLYGKAYFLSSKILMKMLLAPGNGMWVGIILVLSNSRVTYLNSPFLLS